VGGGGVVWGGGGGGGCTSVTAPMGQPYGLHRVGPGVGDGQGSSQGVGLTRNMGEEKNNHPGEVPSWGIQLTGGSVTIFPGAWKGKIAKVKTAFAHVK